MTAPSSIHIAPSILSADFGRLAAHVAEAAAGGAALLHCDVMDGRYVPNITIGIPVVAALRRVTTLPLDVHLMIVEPERYVGAFRDAGADMISIHAEAATHLHHTLTAIKKSGAKAGVALNPATGVDGLRHVADILDYVLVMSVNPGWGGQAFIPGAVAKVAETRRLLDANGGQTAVIEVDGGIGTGNARSLVEAGATILVCGSSVFGTADPASAVRAIAAAAAGA